MTTLKTTWIIVATLVTEALSGTPTQWHISQKGRDSPGCGTTLAPCRTLRYTVPKTSNLDVINIADSDAPYTDQTSADSYISVSHSLTIRALGNVTIACPKNRTKLFNVTTLVEKVSSADATLLALQGVSVENCAQSSPGDTGVVVIHNARMEVVNVKSRQNQVFIHHPKSLPGCVFVDVNITDFFAEQSEKAKHEVLIQGCNTTKVRVTNTVLHSSAISVQAAEEMDIILSNVNMTGEKLTSYSSVEIITGTQRNNIIMDSCSVKDHGNTTHSPIFIHAPKVLQTKPQIKIMNVQFRGNNLLTNGIERGGGALAILTGFAKTATFSAEITGCLFEHNSVQLQSKPFGGAVYLKKVSNVLFDKCIFHNNSALVGGALYLDSSNNITLRNCWLYNNTADDPMTTHTMANGGGIYALISSVTVDHSNLVDNIAGTSGSHIYATSFSLLTLVDSNITTTRWSLGVYESSLVYVGLGTRNNSIKSSVAVIRTTIAADGLFPFTPLLTSEVNVTQMNNTFRCPLGNHVNYTGQAPQGNTFRKLALYCESCTHGQYSLNKYVWKGNVSDIPKWNTFCRVCPDHAKCVYGQIWPEYNYWLDFGTSNSSTNEVIGTYICASHFCTGNDTLKLGTPDGACAPRRTGVLCSKCEAGYTETMADRECIAPEKCRKPSVLYLFIFSSCVVYILLGLIMLSAWRLELVAEATSGHLDESEGCPEREELLGDSTYQDLDDSEDQLIINSASFRRDVELTRPSLDSEVAVLTSNASTGHDNHLTFPVVFLIIFIFFQLSPMVFIPLSDVRTIHIMISNSLQQFFNFRPMFSAIGGDCNFPSLGSLSQTIFDILMPILLLFLVCLCWLVVALVDRFRRVRYGRTDYTSALCHYLGGCFFWFLIASYVPLLETTFRFLHCIPLKKNSVLFGDVSRFCFAFWQIPVVIGLIVYLLPLPVAVGMTACLPRGEFKGRRLVLFCAAPLVYCLTICVNRLRNGTLCRDWSLPESPNAFTPPSHYGKIFFTLLLKPFNTYVENGKPGRCRSEKALNGLSAIMIKCVLICGAGIGLSHMPVLRAFMVTLLSLFYLLRHLTTTKRMGRGVQEAVTIGFSMMTILSFLNIYAATLYQFSFHSLHDGTPGLLMVFCESVYVITMLVPTSVIVVLIVFAPFLKLVVHAPWTLKIQSVTPTAPGGSQHEEPTDSDE